MTVLTPPPGLRDHLAVRAERATALTSPDRVLERVDRRVARPHRRTRTVAVVLAAATAAALTGAVLVPRLVNRATSPQPAQPTPPPAGLPVIWHLDAHDATLLDAVDWSGRTVGAVRVPPPQHRGPNSIVYAGFQQNADGSRILVTQRMTPSRWVIDRSGRRVLTLPPAHLVHDQPDFTDVTFADDGTTLCEQGGLGGAGFLETGGAGAAWALSTIDASGHETRVFDTASLNLDGEPTLLACSVRNDVAVVDMSVRAADQTVADRIVAVRLSTGAVLGPTPIRGISADGRVIEEHTDHAGVTRLRDARTGRTIGDLTLGANDVMAGFTADTRFALVQSNVLTDAGTGAHLRARLVDVGTGRVLWDRQLPWGGTQWVLQPDGDSVAVKLWTAFNDGELMLIRPDGGTTVVAQGFAG